jgi:DNA-binding SARP family transcriptional activator
VTDPSAGNASRGLAYSLLGRFAVRGSDCKALGAQKSRSVELLGYLALFARRAHHREILADELWGGGDDAHPRKGLRQALWLLHGLRSRDAEPLVEAEGEWLQLNERAVASIDIVMLEDAFTGVRGTPGDRIDESQARALRRAVDVYGGDLLEGWYQDWTVLERERLKAMYLSMLDKLVLSCEARHEFELGLSYCELLLRHDRAHELAHVRMMRMHYLSGNRTAAIRQFARCASALEEELGVGPSRTTMLLLDQIRTEGCMAPLDEGTRLHA